MKQKLTGKDYWLAKLQYHSNKIIFCCDKLALYGVDIRFEKPRVIDVSCDSGNNANDGNDRLVHCSLPGINQG